MERKDRIYSLLEEMIRRGLASTSNNWIEEGIRTRNPKLSIGIAASKVLVYDKIDRYLLPFSDGN